MKKLFQRKIEDFVCEHCGANVSGDGYTNHCPKCLWSKHVDVNPGDREAHCKGPMEPIGLVLRHGEQFICQRCVRCGFERPNGVRPEDDTGAVLALAGAVQFGNKK